MRRGPAGFFGIQRAQLLLCRAAIVTSPSTSKQVSAKRAHATETICGSMLTAQRVPRQSTAPISRMQFPSPLKVKGGPLDCVQWRLQACGLLSGVVCIPELPPCPQQRKFPATARCRDEAPPAAGYNGVSPRPCESNRRCRSLPHPSSLATSR